MCRYAGTIVGNGDADQLGGRVEAAGHPYAARAWVILQRLLRIDDQIEQHLMELVGIGVDQRDDQAAATAQLQDLGVTYPNIFDGDGRYATNFNFVGLPDTYVVDRTGTIRYQVIGQVHDAATLTSLLNRLLAAPAS